MSGPLGHTMVPRSGSTRTLAMAPIQWHSVVVPCLEKVDLVTLNEIDDSVFLSEPARPGTFGEVLQWFRLANPLERVSQNCLHQIESAQSHLPILGDPEPQVVDELRVEHRLSPLRLAPPRTTSLSRQDRQTAAAE
jgi:hypothetical protein